jgi:hypothetical protein
VQAERADFGPEIPGELIAAVDFGGARRDLVLRKRMHRLADRICGLAEIEVEHPKCVGDHGRLRRIKTLFQTALFFADTLVTRRNVPGHPRPAAVSIRPNASNSPLRRRTARDVIG